MVDDDTDSSSRGRSDERPSAVSHMESADSNQITKVAPSTPRMKSIEREEPIGESSPLLSPSNSEDGSVNGLINDENEHGEDEYQSTKSTGYIILLVLSIGGLQVAWSTELSNGSPYLLSLGITKSLMALVWIAGPLSGSLVQPYVGMLSDNCRLSWGKRKPYMLGGTVATCISLIGLAWAREIVETFFGWFDADIRSNGVQNCVIIWAVLFVYILDFAINTVQAGIRAFMVDCAPVHQQDETNAMASRVLGIGNILGYVFGYIDLPKHFWFFGRTQFQVLCVIAAISLSTTVAISSSLIFERDPRLEGPAPKGQGGLIAFFKSLFKSIRTLPPQTRKVCEVQFFAWVGWFGFLFYCTTWIGELWVQPYFIDNPNMTKEEVDAVYEKSTRIGTFALLIWAITSLLANVLLPFFVAPAYDIATPKSSSQSIMSTKSYTTRLDRFLESLIIPWLTLKRAWMISLGIFALTLFSTLIITSPTVATIAVGFVGIPWAMTLWAPFAIIAAEVSKRDAIRRANAKTNNINDANDNGDQAGVILGIHNMSVATPQVLATMVSSLIFKIFQKPRGTPGDRSLPIVLTVFGLSVCVSVWLASRLSDKEEALPADVLAAGEGRPRRGFGGGGGGH